MSFQNVVPLLKYVRGEALSPDHWLELFRLLKMPKGTILDKLTFGDVLESADQIIINADTLKVNYSGALAGCLLVANIEMIKGYAVMIYSGLPSWHTFFLFLILLAKGLLCQWFLEV